MIYFNTRNYTNTQTPDELISRLKWKTHLVDNVELAKTNSILKNHQRPLIGKINEQNHTFKFTRPKTILSILLPKVIISGKINSRNQHSEIIFRYKLGILSSLLYAFIIWATISVTYDLVSKSVINDDLFISYFIFMLFPIFGLIFSSWEINQSTKIALDILGLPEET